MRPLISALLVSGVVAIGCGDESDPGAGEQTTTQDAVTDVEERVPPAASQAQRWDSRLVQQMHLVRRARQPRDQPPRHTERLIRRDQAAGKNPDLARLAGRDKYGDPVYLVPVPEGFCFAEENASGGCGPASELAGTMIANECTRHRASELRLYGVLPDDASNVALVRRNGTRFPISVRDNFFILLHPRRPASRVPAKLVWSAQGKRHSRDVPISEEIARLPC